MTGPRHIARDRLDRAGYADAGIRTPDRFLARCSNQFDGTKT
jgi:hypothetical protein